MSLGANGGASFASKRTSVGFFTATTTIPASLSAPLSSSDKPQSCGTTRIRFSVLKLLIDSRPFARVVHSPSPRHLLQAPTTDATGVNLADVALSTVHAVPALAAPRFEPALRAAFAFRQFVL